MNSITATFDPHEWVLAAPFRSHFQALIETSGLSWQVVALAAPIPLATGRRLVSPPRRRVERIRRIDAVRVNALSPASLEALDERMVPAGPARVMLRRIQHGGASAHQIGSMLRYPLDQLTSLADGATVTVPLLTELRLRACCEDPQLLPPDGMPLTDGTSVHDMALTDLAA